MRPIILFDFSCNFETSFKFEKQYSSRWYTNNPKSMCMPVNISEWIFYTLHSQKEHVTCVAIHISHSKVILK